MSLGKLIFASKLRGNMMETLKQKLWIKCEEYYWDPLRVIYNQNSSRQHIFGNFKSPFDFSLRPRERARKMSNAAT